MNIKRVALRMICLLLALTKAITTSAAFPTSFLGTKPVLTLQGGFAEINVGDKTKSYAGTDDNLFTYTNVTRAKNTGITGIFLGLEKELRRGSEQVFLIQTGVEYNYLGSVHIKGANTAGIEASTSTLYDYNYKFQAQQVLGLFKLFTMSSKIFHPYGEVGLGAAFNQAAEYHAITTEAGSINLTPFYGNRCLSQFSYILGLGIDASVSSTVRLGLGYRYSNLGHSALGAGVVRINNYEYPVPFTYSSPNIYANQFIAHVSYLLG